LVIDESTTEVVEEGTFTTIAAWLKRHSYMGVWALAHYDGVLGVYVRKEGVLG
jgi:hypothetical protein